MAYLPAEKMNIKVVTASDLEVTGAALTAEKARAKAEAEDAGRHLLRVPRRCVGVSLCVCADV